jgi:hypothetical protein
VISFFSPLISFIGYVKTSVLTKCVLKFPGMETVQRGKSFGAGR